MNVALILPPFSDQYEIFSKRLAKWYFTEGNVTAPLGLGYIASVLENEGHTVSIIDMNASGIGLTKLINVLQKFNPELIGFSLLTHIFPFAVTIMKALKKIMPSVPIIVGGQHIGFYPHSILEIPAIDYGIRGEGEITIKEFIKTKVLLKTGELSDRDRELKKIKGLIFRDESNSIIVNPLRELIKDLDELPLPVRHLFNFDDYRTLFMQKSIRASSMITSRGCPFQCNYCSERYSKYRVRSVESVLDEIEEVYTKYNVREIHFHDGTFTAVKKRTIELCKGIIKRGFKIIFNIRTRVDTIDEEILKYLAAAGCRRIHYGFESGDNGILKNLNKNTTVNQIVKATRLTKKYGIKILAFFMIGSPGETRETINKTISLALALNPDYVQFTRLNPFVGSYLYKQFYEKTGNDVWLDFCMGRSKSKDVIMPDSKLSKRELDKLISRAYRQFYFRPKYMLMKLQEIRSLGMLKRYFLTAISILG